MLPHGSSPAPVSICWSLGAPRPFLRWAHCCPCTASGPSGTGQGTGRTLGTSRWGHPPREVNNVQIGKKRAPVPKITWLICILGRMCDFNSAEGGQLDREFGRCLYAPDVAAFLKTVCIFQSDPSASAPTPPAPTIWGEAQWLGVKLDACRAARHKTSGNSSPGWLRAAFNWEPRTCEPFQRFVGTTQDANVDSHVQLTSKESCSLYVCNKIPKLTLKEVN